MADVTRLENMVSSSQHQDQDDTSIESTQSMDEPISRCVSPRRDNTTIEQIGREKVTILCKEAQLVQENLGVILSRISQAKEEYDRLSNENKFLQDYIGNLMDTSNILNKNTS